MKTVMVTGPGQTATVDADRPAPGPRDVLVRMRACGICGSDALYISVGGIPPRQGATPLGHEPAGEVVEVGEDVRGLEAGDHVVINPMASSDGIIGSGGAPPRSVNRAVGSTAASAAATRQGRSESSDLSHQDTIRSPRATEHRPVHR